MIYFLISSVIIFLLGNMYSLNRLYALPLICPILLAIAFGVVQLRPSASDKEIPMLNHASHGRFPLNLTHRFVKYFDGANDGLVGEESFPWGQDYRLLTVKGRRGISHGDVIDLNRENIPEFDVREFYVQLVHDLKEKGF